MDISLRCNTLKCRQRLSEQAVVTTCSHIFCVACSESLGLSTSSGGVRVCPACEAQLANPDDAVMTRLSPSEDYKTSVLSGLNPTIIMECCSRGISFFHYQISQEIMYHDYMAKNLADRYSTLNSQMDNVIKDANTEIGGLRDRLERTHFEKKTLEQKNQELIKAFSEKSRAHARLQKMYDRAKGTQDAQYMQHAAADDADHVIQSMHGPSFVDALRNRAPQRPASAHVRGGGVAQDMPQVYSHGRVGSYGGGAKNQAWSSQGSHGGQHPPQYSQNITSPNRGIGFSSFANRPSESSMRHTTPNRQPLGDIGRNMASGQRYDGYGSVGGVRVDASLERPPAIINRNLANVLRR